MQPIKPIRNEADYDLALQEIDRCLDAVAGSPERDRLEVLTVLVDDYEARHHPISPPDPIAAIEFVLEQRGLSRKDLEGVIGSSRAYFRGDEQATTAVVGHDPQAGGDV